MGFLTRFMVFCIVTIIFIATLAFTGLVGVEVARDYTEYKNVSAATCSGFMADLKGTDPARTAEAIELFNAPSGNLFFKLYQPDIKNMPPKFTDALATCTKLPQLTLLQAMRSAASTGVDSRVKLLLATEGMVPAAAPLPAAAPEATAVSATAVSATVPAKAEEEDTAAPAAKPAKATPKHLKP